MMLLLLKRQVRPLFKFYSSKNISHKKIAAMEDDSVLENCKKLLPPLNETNHKGVCGRVGIIGGSVEFTGAPYYAGISALRSGADLVYVFTVSSAAPVIKTFSPELMVMPYLDSERGIDLITPWLNRLHVLLIGPGLGRNEKIFATLIEIINVLKINPNDAGYFRPIVFDADGLYFLSKNPSILRDYPGDVYITPNLVEFNNLISTVLGINDNKPPEVIEALCKEIGNNVTVVLKGRIDLICNVEKILQCKAEGSHRRCGGQGDLLSGVLATFSAWVALRRINKVPHITDKFTDNILAGYSACCLTRACNRAAYRTKQRTMLTTDMISEFPKVFTSLFSEV